MKAFRLLAAALVISGVTAHADPFVRSAAAQPETAPSPSDRVPVGAVAYQDYPPYPPGFSSYRGLGFMGFCCEPISPCAQNAWAGYCDEQACGEPAHGPSLFEKLHGWLDRPAWTCCPQSYNPCEAGCGASGWPIPPLGCQGKPLRMRGHFAGIPGGCHAGGESCGKGSEPTTTETLGTPEAPATTEAPEAIETLPTPPASAPLTPQTTHGIIPNLPSPLSPERSASRADLRRLPGVEGSY